MPKADFFDAQKYRDNPKMIAKYLNVALATDDVAVVVKAIGDMLRAHGIARVSPAGEPHLPFHAADRGTGAGLEFARAMKEAAN